MNPLVADLWCEFATLGGIFPLCSREMAFRFGEIFRRYMYFDTEQRAIAYLAARSLPLEFASCIEKKGEGKYRLPYVFKDSRDLADFITVTHPVSLEFGPVYMVGDRATAKQEPHFIRYAPLVFDIDIDEYDLQRTCKCKGDRYAVCDDCWVEFMQPAILYLKSELEKTFGFGSVLVVFSGRRGFHVWVLDEEVWGYSRAQRQAIYDSLPGVEFDRRVGTDVTHLLKAPLLVHPKSDNGWMSIPIDEHWKPSLYPEKVDLNECIRVIRRKIEKAKAENKDV